MTAPALVRSDANDKPCDRKGFAEAVHRFAKPGHGFVRGEGVGHKGMKATGQADLGPAHWYR